MQNARILSELSITVDSQTDSFFVLNNPCNTTLSYGGSCNFRAAFQLCMDSSPAFNSCRINFAIFGEFYINGSIGYFSPNSLPTRNPYSIIILGSPLHLISFQCLVPGSCQNFLRIISTSNRQLHFLMADIVLKGFGDQSSSNGALHFSLLSKFELRNVTFTNNVGVNGAAVFLNNISESSIQNCMFENNRVSGAGGALFIANSSNIQVQNCTIIGNYATNYGGGIYLDRNNNISILFTIIRGNTATLDGGGVYLLQNNNYVYFTSSQITSNVAQGGGGIYFYQQNMHVRIATCILSQNNALADGGAVHMEQFNQDFTIISSTITGNGASGSKGGAGIFLNQYNSILNLISCVISGNLASHYGGALYLYMYNDHLTMRSCTLLTNTAYIGGGAICLYEYNTYVTALSTDISGNNGGYGGGGMYLISFNSNIYLTSTRLSSNTASSGGGLLLYQTNSYVTISACNFQNNIASGDGGGLIAYSGNFFITILKTTFKNNVASNGGGIISVQNSFVTITSSVFLGNNATFEGGGLVLSSTNLYLTILGCNFQNNVAGLYGGGIFVSISNSFTITNSNFGGNTAAYGGGLAIACTMNSVTLNSNIFHRNKAISGGALFIITIQQSFQMNNSTFKYNFAQSSAGGVFISLSANIAITNCAFSNNVALSHNGGAVYVLQGVSALAFTNCNFLSNAAGYFGGGIAIETDNYQLRFSNLILMGNFGAYSGGAIYIGTFNNNVYFLQTMISSNKAGLSHGGGAYIGTSNIQLNFESVHFLANIAMSQGQNGGAIFSSQSNRLYFSDCTFANNVAHGSGGAICLSTSHTAFVAKDSNFTNNIAEDGNGGGVAVAGADNFLVSIFRCLFQNNTADALGGALYLSNVNESELHSLEFMGNTASLGGASYHDVGDRLTLTDSQFIHNTGLSGGGASVLSSCYKCNILNNSFTLNEAGNSAYGGALRVDFSDALIILSNHFVNNSAGWGIVMWNSSTMDEPVGLLHVSNQWSGNVALSAYPWASSIYSLAADRNMSIPRYVSTIPAFTVQGLDYYGERVILENTATVTARIHSYSCGRFFGSLAGTTSLTMTRGEVTYESLLVRCAPGGSVQLSFSSPLLEPSTFISQLSFENCLIGDNPTSSTCTCLGFCNASQIIIKSGTWRISPYAFTAQSCPYSAACLGGLLTGAQSCAVGYEGPYCSVCSNNYYRSNVYGKCIRCREESATAGTYGLVLGPALVFIFVFLIIVTLLRWWVVDHLVKRSSLTRKVVRPTVQRGEAISWINRHLPKAIQIKSATLKISIAVILKDVRRKGIILISAFQVFSCN